MKRGLSRARGVTLIELIITISVMSVAGIALVSTLSYLSGTGSDHVLRSQAQSIANAYLNEITGKCFADCLPGVEASRMQFDDVTDYQGLDTLAATDQMNNAAGNFRVRVNLTAGGLGALPANAVWRIDVTVDYDRGKQVIATGYKTNHP